MSSTRRWINDGSTEQLIRHGDLPPGNWRPGRISAPRNKHATNDPRSCRTCGIVFVPRLSTPSQRQCRPCMVAAALARNPTRQSVCDKCRKEFVCSPSRPTSKICNACRLASAADFNDGKRINECHKCRKSFKPTRCQPYEQLCGTCKAKRQKERHPGTQLAYMNRRYAEDLQFRIAATLRARTRKAVQRGTRGGSAIRDLGCSIAEFIAYIEAQFAEGMSWNNYGIYWNLDHKLPLAAFDLKDTEQFKKAAHYSNYQPLTVADNRKKSDHIL